MDQVVNLQPAYVLHRKPFREQQVLVELFTPDFGRVCVMASENKQQKNTSHSLSHLQPFSPVMVSWKGEADVKSVTKFESVGQPPVLVGSTLICGMYLNELLYRLVPRWDSQPLLFAIYSATLEQMVSEQDLEPILRRFEMQLLLELGYGVNFECDMTSGRPILPKHWYQYKVQQGFVEAKPPASRRMVGVFPGDMILAIALEDFSTVEARRAAKWVMRRAISHLLGDKPLNSRKLFLKGDLGI